MLRDVGFGGCFALLFITPQSKQYLIFCVLCLYFWSIQTFEENMLANPVLYPVLFSLMVHRWEANIDLLDQGVSNLMDILVSTKIPLTFSWWVSGSLDLSWTQCDHVTSSQHIRGQAHTMHNTNRDTKKVSWNERMKKFQKSSLNGCHVVLADSSTSHILLTNSTCHGMLSLTQ